MKSINKQFKILLPLLGCAILAAIWLAEGYLKLLDWRLIPTLPEVLLELVSLLARAGTWLDIAKTMYRILLGFLIAAVIAIPLGLMFGIWKQFRQMFAPAIDFMRSLPGTAMFPLFLLIFGIGDGSKVATAGFLSFWMILINSIYGARYVTPQRKLSAQSLGASRWRIFFDVTLREATPHILAGLKTSLALATMSVVISEMMIGSNYGVGQKIYDSYISYDTAKLFAWIVISGLIGLIFSKIFSVYDTKLLHWTNK